MYASIVIAFLFISNAAFSLTSFQQTLPYAGLSFNALHPTKVATLLEGNSILSTIENRLPNSFFGVRERQNDLYDVTLNGVPVCHHQMKLIRQFGTSTLLGSIPSLDEIPSETMDSWPNRDETIAHTGDHLNLDIAATESASPCFFIAQNHYVAAWELVFLDTQENRTYVVADPTEVLYHTNLAFYSDGSAKVFARNDLTPLKTFNFNLNTPSNLENGRFKVDSPYPVPTSSNGAFNFDPSSKDFETSLVFAHVEDQLQFFERIGFKFRDRTIALKLFRSSFSGNAKFDGPDDRTADYIMIGTDRGLTNLHRDGDVVRHELGHYVIRWNLSNRLTQAQTLHEGLSDTFVNLANDDPDVGQTVCRNVPYGCNGGANFLRSANNHLKYSGNDNEACEDGSCTINAHDAGQMIAGLIWDFKNIAKLPSEQVAKILLKAVEMLRPDSDFEDLLLALLLVDKQQFSAAYQNFLITAMKGRNLFSLIADVDLKAEFGIRYNGSQSSRGEEEGTHKKEWEKVLGCSIGGSKDSSNRAHPIWILLLTLPMILMAATRIQRKINSKSLRR